MGIVGQAQILPLRKTISRLTRENNQLHGRMIKQAELEDEHEAVFKREIGTLKGQLEDMHFLSGQKDMRLAEQRYGQLQAGEDGAILHCCLTACAASPPACSPAGGARS